MTKVEKLEEQAKKGKASISLRESSVTDLQDQPSIKLMVAATTPPTNKTRVIKLKEKEPTPQASQEEAPSKQPKEANQSKTLEDMEPGEIFTIPLLESKPTNQKPNTKVVRTPSTKTKGS